MYPRPRLFCFWPRFESSGGCFCRSGTAFTFFDHIHNFVIHLRPINIASHETLHSIHSRVPVWKSLKILFCNFFGITTLSLYRKTLSHSENTSGTFSFFAVIFCLILVIKSSFIASLFISSSVVGSSLMVLAIMFLISQSVRKAAIIVS